MAGIYGQSRSARSSPLVSYHPIWEAPVGVRADVVGAMRRGAPAADRVRVPLTLLLFDDVSRGDVDRLGEELGRRLRSRGVARPSDLHALLGGLVHGQRLRGAAAASSATAVEGPPSDRDPPPRHADEGSDASDDELPAFKEIAEQVGVWERAFRGGDDFTGDEHLAMETTMHELVMAKAADMDVPDEAARVGLEARLRRLLEAQATRDASGSLQRGLSALTSLVLVPTLVAGAYGANLSVPLANSAEGWRAMMAFMAAGGTLAYLLLLSMQLHPETRRLRLVAPGGPVHDASNDPGDRAWNVRIAFMALCGAALSVTVSGICAVQVHYLHSSSFAALVVVALALLGALGWMCCQDRPRHRSYEHMVVDVLFSAFSAITVYGLITRNAVVAGYALALGLLAITFYGTCGGSRAGTH